MGSTLILSPTSSLQEEINRTLKELNSKIGAYVSLNKTLGEIKKSLNENAIKTERIFFIDCITNKNTKEQELTINPDRLDLLEKAIENFMIDIKMEKFILFDAFSRLFISNTDNEVLNFIARINEKAKKNNSEIIAFLPKRKKELLLNKLSGYFDEIIIK